MGREGGRGQREREREGGREEGREEERKRFRQVCGDLDLEPGSFVLPSLYFPGDLITVILI